MTVLRPVPRVPLAVEAALAMAAALAVFAATAAGIHVTHAALAVFVVAVLGAAAVAWAARDGLGLYAVPLAGAALLAFELFRRSPGPAIDVPHDTEWAALLIYVGIAVLVSVVSARSRRRIESMHGTQERLARDQASLRTVATSVAEGAPLADVLDLVAQELGEQTSVDVAAFVSYDHDATATVRAGWRLPPDVPVGTRLDLTDVEAAGRPVVVDGRPWGALVIRRRPDGTAPPAEEQITDYLRLVATAVANAEARDEVTASRARIVSAADAVRRGIERDLHDGIQQRVVSLSLDVRRTQMSVPPEEVEVRKLLAEVVDGLTEVFDELREIARGVHPAILTEGGLGPALRALVLRSATPADLEVRCERRLPDPVEVAAYYVVSEALTNVAKHASASRVAVVVEEAEEEIELRVVDDGVGGARDAAGSGLVGLRDRVEALSGTLDVRSPAGGGTTLTAKLPVLPPVSGAGPAGRQAWET